MSTDARADLDSVQHMVLAGETIAAYTKGGKRRFMANPVYQDAVARRLEVLGEAARRLSPAFRDEHPGIPWRTIIGMRNFLLHAYDAIDLEKVWDAVRITVNETLPALRKLVA